MKESNDDQSDESKEIEFEKDMEERHSGTKIAAGTTLDRTRED
jgi:hypothetical protein